MNKKAQLSMFMLVAVIIIILVGTALTYGPKLLQPQSMDTEVPN